MCRLIRTACMALAVLALPLPATAQEEPLSFFTLAGGDISGNYFAAARAICREVNRAALGKMRCSPEATPGSVYNLSGLRSGAVDFAIVQSDWLVAARDGTGPFAEGGPFGNLRGVARLYPETITILAATDSGITQPSDLVGKRIDIGPPASGRRATANRILTAIGVDPAGFGTVSELPTTTALGELCSGRIDAVFLVVGHPDASVGRTLTDCGARMVALTGGKVAAAIEALGSYERQSVPAGLYPEITSPVSSFGVTADIVTRSAVPVDQVDAVSDILRTRKTELVRLAPVLDAMDADNLWPDVSILPAHRVIASGQ